MHAGKRESKQPADGTSELLPDAALIPPVLSYLNPRQDLLRHSSETLRCPAIDFRSWRSWQDVGKALSGGLVCTMHQAWVGIPDQDFNPAAVAIAHFYYHLIVYAELEDRDIFNAVSRSGEPAFRSGDTFEIFLRAEDEENYLEHHITPHNFTWQIRWPGRAAVKEAARYPNWSTEFIGDTTIPSRTIIQPELCLWRVLAIVPLSGISSVPDIKNVKIWHFSFCRYDYTRGSSSPVLSSTSPHSILDFHEHHAWRILSLSES